MVSESSLVLSRFMSLSLLLGHTVATLWPRQHGGSGESLINEEGRYYRTPPGSREEGLANLLYYIKNN